jgi:type IV pilus assembly protein PilP
VRVRGFVRLLALGAATACVALLGGCGGGGMNDLHQWVASVEARPGPPIPKTPTPPSYQTYTWADQKLRSPFLPVSKNGGVRPNLARQKEYLEQFPLDSLKLVGELAYGGGTYALILDPEGVVTRVTVGNYLGQNNGRIVAIIPSGIEIREIVPNGTGGWVERPASLSLGQQSGG